MREEEEGSLNEFDASRKAVATSAEDSRGVRVVGVSGREVKSK